MQINQISIEHVVVTSKKSYETVHASLLERVSKNGDLNSLIQQLLEKKTPWKQAQHEIEKQLGSSGFNIFCIIEHGSLLTLVGKPRKIVQYTIGNPLIAFQITQHVPAAALYAPFKLALYEDENGITTIAYDRFSSFLSQFHNQDIMQAAHHVDTLLQELITAII
jgi:uncharacterized protein (DUF302 family)